MAPFSRHNPITHSQPILSTKESKPAWEEKVKIGFLNSIDTLVNGSRFALLRHLPHYSTSFISFVGNMDVLCVYCFDVLVSELEKRSPIPFPAAQLAKTKTKSVVNSESESNHIVTLDTT